MTTQTLLASLVNGENLSEPEMAELMQSIMTGEATSAQIGAALTALKIKGETVTEIAAAAQVMRSLATPLPQRFDHLVDTCGTGGSGSNIFNVSTASAIVAASLGVKVAKHGNRAASGVSGSADVLEAAGVRLVTVSNPWALDFCLPSTITVRCVMPLVRGASWLLKPCLICLGL